MKPAMRNYQSEDDYWCIREFLREVSLLNDRHDFSWSLLRWDYWRWHVNENIFHLKLEDVVTLWEVNGQIVAVLNPDHDDEAFFQIHPNFQNDVLMAEMLDVAEGKLPKIKEAGRRELILWVNPADDTTKTLFTHRGYARSKFSAEHMRSRCLSQPDTLSARWVTRANCPPAAGFRGKPFTRMSQMKNMRAGNGTKMCSVFRSIGATWTLSR